MKLIVNLQNLWQKGGIPLMTKITQNILKESHQTKSSWYSDTYILITGYITVIDINADTNVAFKNCARFTTCIIHINDEEIDTAGNFAIIIPMYNLTVYLIVQFGCTIWLI